MVKSRPDYAVPQRRHPRLVRASERLRRHRALVGVAAALTIIAIFYLDLRLTDRFLWGLYLVPLTLLAVATRERVVAWAALACIALNGVVLVAENALETERLLALSYQFLAGTGLVLLAYLIERLTALTGYASTRAQLAEASADIVRAGRTRTDLEDLLQYSVDRMGEQVGATAGVLLVLEEREWQGRAGFGLGVDARELSGPRIELTLVDEALDAGRAVVREVSPGESGLALLAPYVRLERVLLVPVQAPDRDVGVIVLNRPRASGEFSGEQIDFVESSAKYVGVAIENVRLMIEAGARRHDLELVRDSSLDFAQSLDMNEVLEAIVARLLDALGMEACDVYEVDADDGSLKLLVSYEDWAFDDDVSVGRVFALEEFATSALAISTRRPVLVNSPDDPRLSEVEAELFRRYGHRTQLSVPLRIRDRVIGLVEVFDNRESRSLSAEQIQLANAICRFAALALDKARLYDEQRRIADRLDRLAAQLQQLQGFALEVNRRLEIADPQEVLDEAVRVAVELLGVRVAAAVGGQGDQLVVQALAVATGLPWGAGDVDGETGEAGHIADAGEERVGVRRGAVTVASSLDTLTSGPLLPVAIAGELLERARPAFTPVPDTLLAPDGVVTPWVDQSDGLLIVPIESETPQHVAALVMLDKQVGRGTFDDDDRLLAATLAATLGASLHNATVYQREHEIAETFQQAMLMQPPPLPGVDVGVCYRAATEAAKVGGDFYDLVSLGPNRLMVVVGDVCGKGLAAAAESAIVRYMLRAYAQEEPPGQALSRLNATVLNQLPGQPFITLVVAYVDVARHMIEYAVAGHPRPTAFSARTEFPLPSEGGVPVGIFRGAIYPTHRVVLPEDSCVVLYTDGLIEARSETVMFGEKRLVEVVHDGLALGAQELSEHLMETVRAYAGGVLADDCAVVVVRLP
jgi:serine phosphatase RsbU (regulator of sigma subunit)/transcriptional regulator with GAF, ATPase, and Fis domain